MVDYSKKQTTLIICSLNRLTNLNHPGKKIIRKHKRSLIIQNTVRVHVIQSVLFVIFSNLKICILVLFMAFSAIVCIKHILKNTHKIKLHCSFSDEQFNK